CPPELGRQGERSSLSPQACDFSPREVRPMPGPLVLARFALGCARPSRCRPSLNHLGFGKRFLRRRVRSMEFEQCHFKLSIYPPRRDNRADVQRRLQGRHVQFAVGEAGEVEHVRLPVQGGGDGLAVEGVSDASVATLRRVGDTHHFHLPSASSWSCLANVPPLTVATSRYVTDVVVTLFGAENKRPLSSETRNTVPYTAGEVMNAAGNVHVVASSSRYKGPVTVVVDRTLARMCQHTCHPFSNRTYVPLLFVPISTMRESRSAWTYGANSLTVCNPLATGASCASGARCWKLPR